MKQHEARNSSSGTQRNQQRSCWSYVVVALILSNLLVMQLMWLRRRPGGVTSSSSFRAVDIGFTPPSQPVNSIDLLNPLAIPPGKAQNLPSIRVEDTKLEKDRGSYGGAGDQKHLGGFTEFDTEGVSPTVWKNMIQEYGVHSLMDVGCGRGISARWFLEHGVDVLCAEGSHDAVEKSFLPSDRVVEHDFSRGPWWPEKTYDAVWSVEFLEHVSRHYHFNYISAFRKAALIFVTHSKWGGWHHVEVHPDEWWIQKFESYGFRYDEKLSQQVRKWAYDERFDTSMPKPPVSRNGGDSWRAVHIIMNMKVFINPVVAALPQHAHLFPEHGCFYDYGPNSTIINKPCGTGRGGDKETVLPDSFLPLNVTREMHDRWDKAIRAGLSLENVV